MFKKLVFFSICFLICLATQAQGVGIGKWKNYFPFRNVIQVLSNGDKVYGATRNGIIINDYEDGTTEQLTEINALSDNNISTIRFNTDNNALVVGYENGNADIIIDNETTNLFQIKESNITGDKGVKSIFCKDDLAYLSCGFGIVVFDVAKKEIKDTYIFGPGGSQIKVNAVFVENGIIYAGTENGLYTAPEASAFLTDFNSWSVLSTIPSGNKEIKDILEFDNKLLFNIENTLTSDSIYWYDGSSWGRVTTLSNEKNNSVTASGNELIISRFDTIYVLDNTFSQINLFDNYDGYWKPRSNYVIKKNSTYYIGDSENGIVSLTSNGVANFNQPNSIFSNNIFDIEAVNGNLWGSSGSLVGGGWNKTFSNDGSFHYDIKEDNWTIYGIAFLTNQFCFPTSCNPIPSSPISCVNDLVGMAINPAEPDKGYACSFSNKGVLELQNYKITDAYDTCNSSLQISSVHNDRIAIADAEFDGGGNLWVVNSWAGNSLSVKTKGGNWKSFDCGASSSNIIGSKIVVSESTGYKWIVFKDEHLLAYNDNGTTEDETDDEFQLINGLAGNGSLDETPTSVAEDKDGEIWIGTEKGIFVIFTPTEIFNSGNFTAQRIKVELEGNVELLLENEFITSVQIDGGNRKWIGTQSSGVFLLSPDGTEQIQNFTKENSPLLSNNINDIAIDGESGEVFIATDQGLISYKGDATEGKQTYQDVYAFPNPVVPGYDGKIGIRGLVENSDVRITDVAGNVVFVTKSLGGQAVWDGRTFEGEKVSSGVYLVFMTNETGTTDEVTKILFIK
ncbi:hypothetical protein OAD98_00350 [Flavobacteriales bacterium]|nr:hypothetical protein [Flavobacteriales bacterium]